MGFAGRNNEIKQLRAFNFALKSGITAIYGRRRIAKAALVEEAFKATKALPGNRVVYGMTNADVTRVQTILARDKSVYADGRVTGYFGPLTLAAVKKFQEKYGIAKPGVLGYGQVGPNTWAKLVEIE